ncbi:MAG: hypothetical protein ACOVNZ_03525, partial [Crocinitomicaceae bacterium]
MKILAFIFLITFSVDLKSQTIKDREEFYKSMISKGETVVKTHNLMKQELFDKILPNIDFGHDNYFEDKIYLMGMSIYGDPNSIFLRYNEEFIKLNKFKSIPDMTYLKKMNAIHEKRNSILIELTKFYEILATEFNSKSFDRIDVNFIDNYCNNNATLKNSLKLFYNLSPILPEVIKIGEMQNIVVSLICMYSFHEKYLLVDNNLGLNEKIFTNYLPRINPIKNYEMINHFEAFNNPQTDSSEISTLKKINYHRIKFYDYPDYKVFSSWTKKDINIDTFKNKYGYFNDEMANSNNSLLIAFFISSFDFYDSFLNELFRKCNAQIDKKIYFDFNEKKCMCRGLINESVDKLDFYLLINNDSSINYIKNNSLKINKLNDILANCNPNFYNSSV